MDDGNFFAVDDDTVFHRGDLAFKMTVNGVIPQQVCQIFWHGIGVVDANEFDVVPVDSRTEDQAADSAEPVDAYFNTHGYLPPSNNPHWHLIIYQSIGI